MLGSPKPVVDRLRETATPTRLLYPRTQVEASAGQAVTFLSCVPVFDLGHSYTLVTLDS
jgi:hypothetical protein